MKTTIILAALSALTFGAVSCSSSSTGQTQSATGVKPYTSNKCIVTDNKLGSMGDPITLIHEGQEVKFCCKPCVAKFKANPEKYLAKL